MSAFAWAPSAPVLPHHSPMPLAKAAATLDVLCGGRRILGVGVGVVEQEFNALVSSYAERGAITDEAIAILAGALDDRRYPAMPGVCIVSLACPLPQNPCRSPTFPSSSGASAWQRYGALPG